MKRIVVIGLSLLLAVSLLGCRETPGATEPVPAVTEATVPETTVPETTVAETTVPEETEPEHSELYLPGVSVEDVIVWFNEVCLDSEYYTSGDPSKVQKWVDPIVYEINGNPTQEDLETLEAFALRLNHIPGFPGIYRLESMVGANLQIYFTDGDSFVDIMGSDYMGLDGAVTYWYDGENRIYDEVICVRNDLDQYVRNSVILEELYNGLGPVQDTILRPDSLIYQEYSEPQELTEVDWLILKLLYHPDMRCGMDAAECEAVIRSLYY